jgi:hypothetical protein
VFSFFTRALPTQQSAPPAPGPRPGRPRAGRRGAVTRTVSTALLVYYHLWYTPYTRTSRARFHASHNGTKIKVPCCRRINGVTRPVHVANWHHNHRTGPPRPSGDREIVGRMERISKGVGWRGVQPEWCMRCSSASTGTALALTVRHASARQERYASCTQLS